MSNHITLQNNVYRNRDIFTEVLTQTAISGYIVTFLIHNLKFRFNNFHVIKTDVCILLCCPSYSLK